MIFSRDFQSKMLESPTSVNTAVNVNSNATTNHHQQMAKRIGNGDFAEDYFASLSGPAKRLIEVSKIFSFRQVFSITADSGCYFACSRAFGSQFSAENQFSTFLCKTESRSTKWPRMLFLRRSFIVKSSELSRISMSCLYGFKKSLFWQDR